MWWNKSYKKQPDPKNPKLNITDFLLSKLPKDFPHSDLDRDSPFPMKFGEVMLLLEEYGKMVVDICADEAKTENVHEDLDNELGSFDTYVDIDKSSIYRVRDDIDLGNLEDLIWK